MKQPLNALIVKEGEGIQEALPLGADRPLHALHFADIVLARDPNAKDALSVKVSALEQLLAASGRENFSEVRWLEAEIRETKAALG